MRIYDTIEYKRTRAYLNRLHRAVGSVCWRCGGWIAPHEPIVVGHDDIDKSIIRGPEHPLCNARTATYKAERKRRKLRTARLW